MSEPSEPSAKLGSAFGLLWLGETAYGLAACERLSGDLARAGLGITSGMARGIDTAAHKAALAGGGDTVAVLGCGVDVVYPSENRKLAGEIATRGLLLSEFPMGAIAFPQNFPVRNPSRTSSSENVPKFVPLRLM